MQAVQSFFKWRNLLLSVCFLLVLLLAGCGGSLSAGTGTSQAVPASRNVASTRGSAINISQQQSNSSAAPQYLIKTLKVGMNVKDTGKVADDLQNWISTTDPRSSSAGINYEQVGNNQYTITLSFSVRASLYPQIEHYLRDYPTQHGGQLSAFNESVQDVTNDYIDTQSRLQNLHGEQTRLLNLLSHANALGDILSIEQKLTDVEGQIENIEAHLKALNDQITFYTITLSLQPLDLATQPQPSWSIGQAVHDAIAASLTFAQALLTLIIWLLAFSIYIVPLAVLAWLVIRWRTRRLTPPSSPAVSPPSTSA